MVGVSFESIKMAVLDYVYAFHTDLYGDIAVDEENMDFYYIPEKLESFEVEALELLRTGQNDSLGELLQEFRDTRNSQFDLKINALILLGLLPGEVWKYNITRTVGKLGQYMYVPDHVMSDIIGSEPRWPFRIPDRPEGYRTFERYKKRAAPVVERRIRPRRDYRRLLRQHGRVWNSRPEVVIENALDETTRAVDDITLAVMREFASRINSTSSDVNDINTSDEEEEEGIVDQPVGGYVRRRRIV